jgi:hypothetical protein
VANVDLLDWFEEAERERCPACGEHALVGAEGAPRFRLCLACAGVWVSGERIDERRRTDLRSLEPPAAADPRATE